MQNPLPSLTKAPLLYPIGAQTYEVSPLSLNDYGAFCQFAQFMPLYAIQGLPNIPDDVRQTVIATCTKHTIAPGTREHGVAAATIEGMTELAYLSLRHKHKQITRNEVAEFDKADIVRINGLLKVLEVANVDADQVADETEREELKKRQAAAVRIIEQMKVERYLV